MNAMVEPLPLVPATWITGGSLRSGCPSAASSRHIRSSERSISLGCSASSRATMESMADMSATVYRITRVDLTSLARMDAGYALAGAVSVVALRQRGDGRRRRGARRPAPW